jgi:REP element-mobilizing transposase RayT
MGGILKSLECIPIRINSEPDHVHLLFAMSRTKTLARTVAKIKTGSALWIKNFDPQLRNFHWQSGYGAFSVGESMLPLVVRYIENQEAHHRTRSFQDEFRALCTAYRIRWDERYVWD